MKKQTSYRIVFIGIEQTTPTVKKSRQIERGIED